MDSTKIINPITKRLITVGGAVSPFSTGVKHKQLIKDGYFNTVILSSDCIIEILNHCDYHTIKNYILTHKYHEISNIFWYNLFNKHNLPILNVPLNVYSWNILYQKTIRYKIEIELIIKYCIRKEIDSLIVRPYFNNDSDDDFDTYYDVSKNIYRVGKLVHPRYHRNDYNVYKPNEFIEWLIELLYKHPKTNIRRSDRLLQMRKKDLAPLINNRGYKTLGKDLMKFYIKNKF